jgi:nitrite reductase/ring-hydroxylating ferredoxin subunit
VQRFPFRSCPFGWYLATYSDDLPRGAVVPWRAHGTDLVIWRGEDGSAHVFDAYCPHLGANVGVGGMVVGCELQCPFHHWTYDGDGRNASIPYANAPIRKARFRTYPVVEHSGAIFTWLHPDPDQAPLWEIPRLENHGALGYTGYEVKRSFRVRVAWQDIAENAVDRFHFKFIHTFGEYAQASEQWVNGPLRGTYSDLPAVEPGAASYLRIANYGPGVSVIEQPGFTILSSLLPIELELMEVRWAWFRPDNESRDRLVEIADQGIAEAMLDVPIWENKIHLASPALAAEEAPIMAFRKWASQFYVENLPSRLNTGRYDNKEMST